MPSFIWVENEQATCVYKLLTYVMRRTQAHTQDSIHNIDGHWSPTTRKLFSNI